MNASTGDSVRTTSHYFLEALLELGVEYVFANFGTDHAPLIEEMARWSDAGLRMPQVILCPHENLAMHMAGGYAMATGRAQAVIVHVDAGTANAAMAAHNMARGRVPLMLIAGRAPFTSRAELPGSRDNYVHFIQEPFDQAAIVRPYVKWEYDLRSGVVVKEVLRRAWAMAQSDPCRPVYLTISREVLAQTWPRDRIRSYSEQLHGPARLGGIDPETARDIARRLLAADNPMLVTSYAGRDPKAPAVLAELAAFAGLRVVETHPLHHNISHEHPCFAGMLAGPFLAQTDLGLLVDTDVPWIPADHSPTPESWWIHVDLDPMKHDLPMWPFPAQQRLVAGSRRVLEQVLEACRELADEATRSRCAQRVERLRQEGEERRRKAVRLADREGDVGAIDPHYVCAALHRELGPDAIVVNEAVRNSGAVALQMPRTRPGTFYGSAGGGLGHSGGVALGVKLARPDATVVQILGDGAYYLGSPSAFHAVASQFGLPILTVVLDNRGWSAVKAATQRVYPDGMAQRRNDFRSLLAPDMNFAKVAEAAGAWGERVDVPAEVVPAIRRALDQLRQGRSALLHMRIEPL